MTAPSLRRRTFCNTGDTDKVITLEQAVATVEELWISLIDHSGGRKFTLDSSLTEEHAWGWVLVFSPDSSDGRIGNQFKHRYVVHRLTGNSLPVGTKGVSMAIRNFAEMP